MCAAPAVVAAVLDAAPDWEGEIPGRDRIRIIVAGAPPPTKTVARVEAELGWEFIQIYGLTETSPLLTVNRTRAEWDDLDRRGACAPSWSAPERRPSASASEIDHDGRGAGPLQRRARGLLGAARGDREPRWRDGWFHTGDGGLDRRRRLPHDPGPQEGRDHHRRRERLVDRGRGRDLQPPRRRRGRRDRRTRREVGRDDQGARGQGRRLRPDRGGADRLRASRRWPATRPRPASSSATMLARTATGKLQKFKLRAPYWEGRDRQVN